MRRYTFTAILTATIFITNLVFGMNAIDIVKKGDDVSNAPKDAHIISTMTIIDQNGNKSVRKSEMYQKGTEKRIWPQRAK